jgi:hypothetical protein
MPTRSSMGHICPTKKKNGFVPDEMFSERNWMAEQESLAKVLFYDVVWQSLLMADSSLVDADNCHDCVSHAIALLVFCYFGVNQ